MSEIRDLLDTASQLQPRDRDPLASIHRRHRAARRRARVRTGAAVGGVAAATAVLSVLALSNAGLALRGTAPAQPAGPPARVEPGVVAEIPEQGAPGVRERYSALRAGADPAQYAVEVATATCMGEAGFAYLPLPRQAFTATALPKAYQDEAVQVSAEGYVLREGALPSAYGAENSGREGLSKPERERYETALNGEAADMVEVAAPWVGGKVAMAAHGCRARAASAVYGSVQDYLTTSALLGDLSVVALSAAASSGATADLDATWARCMDRAGGDAARAGLSSPSEAVGLAVKAGPGGALSLNELARSPLARADAACRKATSYTAARTSIEDRYLTAYWDAAAQEITTARAVLSTAQERARALQVPAP